MVKHYINLTNGIEAIDNINESYSFIRIQSTYCEQKLWDNLVGDLDYDFLMNLALGNTCKVYDFGSRGGACPRSFWQGLPFIEYCLNKIWFNKTTRFIIRGHDCTNYFEECFRSLSRVSRRKLKYFRTYLNTDKLNLIIVYSKTKKDSDKEFYRKKLINRAGLHEQTAKEF